MPNAKLEIHDESGLTMIEVGGVFRVLGVLPSHQTCHLMSWSAAGMPVLPPSHWEEVSIFNSYPDVPLYNQGQFGSCFPAGTLIRMADGSEKPIERICLLDKVLTAEGNIGTVKQTMVRDADELVTLRLWGHSHLRATPEHPVLTKRGYVPIGQIKNGDWVSLPRYAPQNATICTPNIEKSNRVLSKRARYGGVVGRKGIDVKIAKTPDVIHLNYGVGRIFGLFLAEGNTDKCRIVWSFSIDEEFTLVKELVSRLREEFDVESHVRKLPVHNSIKVTVYGVAWARLFEYLFATGAGNKKIHNDLICGPEPFLRAMFDAWMDGDGCKHKRGHLIGKTVSKSLAVSMFDIAQFCGLRPSIRMSKPSHNRHAASRRYVWEVTIAASLEDNYRAIQEEKVTWRRVAKTTKEAFFGKVFNLTVEGDNSYVAEGIGVHNCGGQSGVKALIYARATSGQSMVNLSPTFVYGLCNGGRDQGSVLSDIASALKEYGTCRIDQVPQNSIYRNQFPKEAFRTAKRYRAHETYRLRNWNEIMTATVLRLPVFYGIPVGSNVSNLDGEGLMPLPNNQAGGHAMTGVGTKMSRRGYWMLDTENSWGRWGLSKNGRPGFCYVYEGHFNRGFMEAYAILSAMDDPEDEENDPPVASVMRRFLAHQAKPKTYATAIHHVSTKEVPKLNEATNLPSELTHGKSAFHMGAVQQLIAAGFTAAWLVEVFRKYGDELAGLFLTALNVGITKDLIVTAIDLLGRIGIEVLIGMVQAKREGEIRLATMQRSALPLVPGQEVAILNGPIGKFLIKQLIAMLPSLGLTGITLKLAEAILNALLQNLD